MAVHMNSSEGGNNGTVVSANSGSRSLITVEADGVKVEVPMIDGVIYVGGLKATKIGVIFTEELRKQFRGINGDSTHPSVTWIVE